MNIIQLIHLLLISKVNFSFFQPFFTLLINLVKKLYCRRLPAGFSHAAQCLRHRCRAQPPRRTILNIYEDQNDYQLKQKNGLDFSNFAPTSIINSNSYTVWQKMKVFLLHIFHTSIPEKNDRRDEALFIFFPYLPNFLCNISCLFWYWWKDV